MPDVRRAAAAALRALFLAAPPAVAARAAAGPGRGVAAVGKLEPQPSGDRIGLDQPQLQPLAGAEALAAVVADEALARFVVAIIVRAERRDRDQPVAAQPFDRGEEAERLHPGDPAIDQ